MVMAEENEAAASLEQDIEKFVANRVPGAVLMEAIGQEMVFQLPSSGMLFIGRAMHRSSCRAVTKLCWLFVRKV